MEVERGEPGREKVGAGGETTGEKRRKRRRRRRRRRRYVMAGGRGRYAAASAKQVNHVVRYGVRKYFLESKKIGRDVRARDVKNKMLRADARRRDWTVGVGGGGVE